MIDGLASAGIGLRVRSGAFDIHGFDFRAFTV
jgi:hypothetical protein